MKRGAKARPHDVVAVMDAMKPEILEIHASSQDLDKDIDGHWDVPLVVHFPEYDGETLMDPASPREVDRLAASKFYERCLEVTRRWAPHFKGTPKAIIHPGGWSSEPLRVTDRPAIIDQLGKTMNELNATGVDFLIENMPPFPWFYGGQWNCNIFLEPRECRDICLGTGWGFALDVCHAALWCASVKNMVTLEEFVQIVSPVTAHVHISDARGVDGEGVQIGDGELDLKPILKRLNQRSIGVVPEIWLGHQDNFAGFKLAWERMNALVEA